MALDANQLLAMSQAELDALFSAHEAGPIPDGEAAGTAIVTSTSVKSRIALIIPSSVPFCW